MGVPWYVAVNRMDRHSISCSESTVNLTSYEAFSSASRQASLSSVRVDTYDSTSGVSGWLQFHC